MGGRNNVRLNLTLAEAARAVGAACREEWAGVEVAGVSTDTRTLRPGELFVALKGENFDGREFIGQALSLGAVAVLVEENAALDVAGDQPVLRVADPLTALGDLAAHVRARRPDLQVLAVTGSNGKTTTKEMAAAVCGRVGPTLATRGNFNNLIGLPLTLFRLRPEDEIAVLEMGMNMPGEIARLTEIAAPDIGLVTNIAPAHLAGVGGLKGVAEAKGELFAGLPESAAAVINVDDPLVVEQARSFGGRKITFGLERNAEVYVSGRPAWSMSGVRFTLVTPLGRAEVRLKLLGRHNLVNALAAAAAATAMSIGPEDVAAGLAQLGPHPGRLELKRLPGPIYVLDDTYNANPVSAAAAMSVLRSLSRGKGRKVAVFGDMLELGAHSRFEHDLLGRGAAASKLDLLAAVGPESKATAKAAVKHGLPKKSVAWFDDAAQAAEWLNQRLQPNDRVLVKGSRGMKMERVVRRLAEGGRA